MSPGGTRSAGRSSNTACDHWTFTRHGFQQRQWQPFGQRRKHEAVEQRVQPFRIGARAEQAYPVGEGRSPQALFDVGALRAVAHQQQPRMRGIGGHAHEGFEQTERILLDAQPHHCPEYECFTGYAELRAFQRGRIAAEARRVDAVFNQPDPCRRDARVAQG